MSSLPIKLATRIALYSNVKRAKMSAIAMLPSGHVIAHAHNRRINHIGDIWTQHAEQVLISKLRKLKAFERFGQISIFVCRVTKHGIKLAKPCRRCMELLSKYPVTITYTTGDDILIL